MTRMTVSISQAATYIERDGAKRVADVDAARLGLNTFEGLLHVGGTSTYRFRIHDDDMPALDAARDRVYARLNRK